MIGGRSAKVTLLLDTLETGMERASGMQMNDKTALERLVELSDRIAVMARRLRSVEEMGHEERQESVDLGRKILKGWELEESDHAMDARGKTIGLNIGLPFEQFPNPYITNELNFEFHYFFMRKFWFAYLAKALVIFPGGFGTLDEGLEGLP